MDKTLVRIIESYIEGCRTKMKEAEEIYNHNDYLVYFGQYIAAHEFLFMCKSEACRKVAEKVYLGLERVARLIDRSSISAFSLSRKFILSPPCTITITRYKVKIKKYLTLRGNFLLTFYPTRYIIKSETTSQGNLLGGEHDAPIETGTGQPRNFAEVMR